MRIFALLLVLAASAFPLAAQAVFDNDTAVQTTFSTFAPALTFAHTTTAATNRILLVSIHLNTRGAQTASATSVTYAGLPLTRIAFINDAALVPAGYTKAALDFDSLFLTYVGHGSVDLWANGFNGSTAAQLTNAKLPIVAAMTCLNGYYHDVFMGSLAESLLLAPGGAAAVWASSTLAEPAPQLDATRELMRQLFGGARLGDAVRAAKNATSDADVRSSWILFGDPSMRLK